MQVRNPFIPAYGQVVEIEAVHVEDLGSSGTQGELGLAALERPSVMWRSPAVLTSRKQILAQRLAKLVGGVKR